MRTNSNLNDLMMSLAGSNKLGLTTTVKEQVDDIEVRLIQFRLQSITSKRILKYSGNNRANYRCS